MKTIEIKVYKLSELSEEARQTAIENYRNDSYMYNDYSTWVIDDCYLLEPKHKELISLFGDDFYEKLNKNEKYNDNPLLENNRKVYYSLDGGRDIDISNAMIVRDDSYFLKWLGIDDDLQKEVYYSIGKDTIEFEENDCEYTFTEEEEEILDAAKEKFEDHCSDILNNIKESYEYCFSDEYIIETMEANEYEFTENGERF